MSGELLSIGEVARQVGLKTSAIRYYESVGVLPQPRRVSGQRRYGEETVRSLHVIDVAKRAGFTLDEARVLVANENGETAVSEQLRALAHRKLPEVNALIARAQAMRSWLETATDCNCHSLDVCTLFDEPPVSTSDLEPAGPVALTVTQVGRFHAPGASTGRPRSRAASARRTS